MKGDKDYLLRFNLSSFLGSKVIEVENDDEVFERGVFIPIDINGFYESNKTGNIMCEGIAYANTYSQGGRKTHHIRQRVNNSTLEKMQNIGYTPPIIGGLWPVFSSTGKDICDDDYKRVKMEQFE